jgi:hypothetical protein
MSDDQPTESTRRSAAKKASAKKTSTKKTATEKTATEKTATEKTATEKTATKKSPAKKTASKRTTPKSTSAKTATSRASRGASAPQRDTPSTDAPSSISPDARSPSTSATPSGAPGEPPPGRLDEPDEVMRAAGAIIDVFEHRPDLYLAACANPVRALRDAGVDLSPSVERWVAHRCRFSPEETEELDRLADQITRHLGDIDPDDDTAVRRALRDVGVDIPLRSEPVEGTASAPDVEIAAAPVAQTARRRPRPTGPATTLHPVRRSVLLAAQQLPQVRRWREARRTGPDPLEDHEGAHAVMKPLLEYRRRSATQPRFASDELYERLAATKGGQLARGINIELHVRLTGGEGD